MKYLFFLIIFLLPIGLAYGEVGKNYDNIVTNPNTNEHLWTSHYDRIQNASGNWVNYILTNDTNQIKFESAEISFLYDKINCDFSLYDPITNNLVINSYQTDIAVDGIVKLKSICDVIDFTQTNDLISFTVDRDNFKMIYDLNPAVGLEWTYEITNNKNKKTLFTITETCKDCTPTSIDGDKINFNTYVLNTKNTEIESITKKDIGHNTLKLIEQKGKDLSLIYEKEINDKEILVIDPTFTGTPTEEGRVWGGVSVATTCNQTLNSNNGALLWNRVTSGVNDFCSIAVMEWDISGIADTSMITSVAIEYDVTAIASPVNCAWRVTDGEFPSQADLNDGFTGTLIMKDDTTCKTVADGKTITFNSNATTALTSDLADDQFEIVVFAQDTNRDGTNREVDFRTTDAILTVVYTGTANAPTNFLATAISNSRIDLSWTTPTACGTGCTGYKIWRESPTGGGFTVLVSNTTTTAVTYSNTGLAFNTQYNYKVAAWNHDGLGTNSTTSADTTKKLIDGVTTLDDTDVRPTAVDITWSPPSILDGGITVSGYQINKTTPFSINNVGTIVLNNTNSSTPTTYTISNLTGATNYSLRIGVWAFNNQTYNGSGNIINITTDYDPTATFTVGTFDISQTNTDAIDIRFERTDIDTTSLFLNVTYRNTYKLACDMDYVIGGFNNTYHNLSNVTVDSSHVKSGFWFTNVTNDIIRVDCWDQYNPDNEGSFLIERYDRNATFPLMLQFEQFRDGTFGTEGNFGFFDLITLSAVILSMIGFNRVNPAVGGIFCAVVILFLGWFEIIEMPTIIFSALALVLMLAIGTARSDQN